MLYNRIERMKEEEEEKKISIPKLTECSVKGFYCNVSGVWKTFNKMVISFEWGGLENVYKRDHD